jgi:hypothetical protein
MDVGDTYRTYDEIMKDAIDNDRLDFLEMVWHTIYQGRDSPCYGYLLDYAAGHASLKTFKHVLYSYCNRYIYDLSEKNQHFDDFLTDCEKNPDVYEFMQSIRPQLEREISSLMKMSPNMHGGRVYESEKDLIVNEFNIQLAFGFVDPTDFYDDF